MGLKKKRLGEIRIGFNVIREGLLGAPICRFQLELENGPFRGQVSLVIGTG
jgi:hypothetical protein